MNKHASPSDNDNNFTIVFSIFQCYASGTNNCLKTGISTLHLFSSTLGVSTDISTNKVRQHFSSFPFPAALIMMRKHFQFCFCKIFEDNKIPYQKLLILFESLSLSFNHPVSDKNADKSKDLAVIHIIIDALPLHLPKRYIIVFLPLHVSPSYNDDNQSIHSTTSLRTAPQVAPKPYSIVRNTDVDPLFSISLILDLLRLRV